MIVNNLFTNAKEIILQNAIQRDLTTARCTVLRETLWHARYLTWAQLIARVELRLGKNCFGISAFENMFVHEFYFPSASDRGEGSVFEMKP